MPLVKDCTQFIRYFSPVISVNAAHIYISALPFAPRSSRLTHVYSSKFKNVITVDTGHLLDWPGVQRALLGSESENGFFRDGEIGLVMFSFIVKEPGREGVLGV